MNCGSNAIVVVNAERQCYVFVISPSDKKSPVSEGGEYTGCVWM